MVSKKQSAVQQSLSLSVINQLLGVYFTNIVKIVFVFLTTSGEAMVDLSPHQLFQLTFVGYGGSLHLI